MLSHICAGANWHSVMEDNGAEQFIPDQIRIWAIISNVPITAMDGETDGLLQEALTLPCVLWTLIHSDAVCTSHLFIYLLHQLGQKNCSEK